MYIKDLMKESQNELASLVEDGLKSNDIDNFIDTGVYGLNAILSGSIFKGSPANKITVFAGPEATGKTFFCLSIAKNFLDQNENGFVLYFDTESALTTDIIKSRGIDKKRFGLFPIATVEEFSTQLTKILDKYIKDRKEGKEVPPIIVVLDSAGNLSTSKEMADTAEGKEVVDMTRAKKFKAAFRVLTLKLGTAQIPLYVTNHVYEAVGSYIPMKVLSGGSGLKYAASTIIELSKAKDKEDKEVVGTIITCKVLKGRLTKENSKIKLALSYKRGLDKYYGLLEIAEKYDIFKKVSTRYELPDGRKIFGKQIISNPEEFYTEDILKKIDEATKKEYLYGEGGFDAIEDENVDENYQELENDVEESI